VLPARSIADVRLARHVAGPMCPLCAVRQDAVERAMDSLLAESVNDPATRDQLDQARGYCPEHIGQLLRRDRSASGGTSGSAILFGAILSVRLAELDGLPATRGRGLSRRLEAAARPPACTFCDRARQAEGLASASLVGLMTDAAWSGALARAEFCLRDLLIIWAAVAGAARQFQIEFEPIAAAQLGRLNELAQAVQAFAHNSSYDRRHLVTDEQRLASGRAGAVLGGKDTIP
jgi:hypothetical protein